MDMEAYYQMMDEALQQKFPSILLRTQQCVLMLGAYSIYYYHDLDVSRKNY